MCKLLTYQEIIVINIDRPVNYDWPVNYKLFVALRWIIGME